MNISKLYIVFQILGYVLREKRIAEIAIVAGSIGNCCLIIYRKEDRKFQAMRGYARISLL
mgnify:CR=1 FL=1